MFHFALLYKFINLVHKCLLSTSGVMGTGMTDKFSAPMEPTLQL